MVLVGTPAFVGFHVRSGRRSVWVEHEFPIILSLSKGAPLLLLDEPLAFQDPAHQSRVARWLSASLLRDQALAISAHDVNWIARTATHVLALLPDGRCEQGAAGAMLEAGLLERVYGCG